MIDEKWLTEKQAACDKATAGDWEAYSAMCCPDMGGVSSGPRHVSAACIGRYGHPMTIEDAEFCAMARTALPEAIAEIRRLREALESTKANHRGWCGEKDPDVGHCDCPIGPFNERIEAVLGKR